MTIFVELLAVKSCNVVKMQKENNNSNNDKHMQYFSCSQKSNESSGAELYAPKTSNV